MRNGFHESDFSGWQIDKIEKIEYPEELSYRLEVNNGNMLDGDHHDAFIQKYGLYFTIAGILKRKIALE